MRQTATPTYNIAVKSKKIPLQPLDCARKTVDAVEERQATNITLLDLRPLSTFTDFFVICTAENPRHMKALHDAVDQVIAKEILPLHHVEGTTEGGWMLFDYGDLVVHVFTSEMREYYQLEQIWSGATPLVTIL